MVLGQTGGGPGFSTDSEQTADGARQSVAFANTEAIPEAAHHRFQKAAELTFSGSHPGRAGDGSRRSAQLPAGGVLGLI